ncbi:hypothetical protein NDU88_003190 [Pleurodeles waltl]|uniref:Uncharacterized protein n=1 Tax=Pleurodeles waltl TaxID=8319 RepID=A0AAV7LRD5_PLEWA|nr:hypothetical protein NDU88_003190 [Pleurodeles waltl]
MRVSALPPLGLSRARRLLGAAHCVEARERTDMSKAWGELDGAMLFRRGWGEAATGGNRFEALAEDDETPRGFDIISDDTNKEIIQTLEPYPLSLQALMVPQYSGNIPWLPAMKDLLQKLGLEQHWTSPRNRA